MTVVSVGALAGGLIGAGVAVAALTLRPAPRSLADDLASLTEPAPPARPHAAAGSRWVVRLGTPAVPLLARLGLPRPAVRRDLAVLDADVATHLSEQATMTVAGLVLAPLLAALAGLGVTISVIAAVAGAAGGFLLVDHQARQRAGARRRELRATLSASLDLVVLAADGGAGIDQALTDSATVCRGWAAGKIRTALATARLTRTSPWTALHELGQRAGVPELVELAATTALAGTEGARIRASLSARAAALRTRQLADTELAANRATERMTLPMFLLAAGFVLLIAFPALAGIAGVGTSLP